MCQRICQYLPKQEGVLGLKDSRRPHGRPALLGGGGGYAAPAAGQYTAITVPYTVLTPSGRAKRCRPMAGGSPPRIRGSLPLQNAALIGQLT